MHYSKILATLLISCTSCYMASLTGYQLIAQTTMFSNEDTKINLSGNVNINVYGDFRQNRTDTMNTIYGLNEGTCLNITEHLNHMDAYPFSYTNDQLKLTLNGTTQQQLNTLGNGILNLYSLRINNPSGVLLNDSLFLNDTLHFVQGQLSLNGYNLILDDLDAFLGNGDDPILIGENEFNRVIGNGKIRLNEMVANLGSNKINLSNLGAEIKQSSATQVQIERTHTTQDVDPTVPGNESIALKYFIQSNSEDPADFTFHYFNNMTDELSEAVLNLYRSEDGSTNWINEGFSSRDLVEHSVTQINTDTLSPRYWTLSPCEPPVVTLSHNDADGYICAGDGITLTASHQSDYYYTWSTGQEGEGLSQITFSESNTGIQFYTVTVTNALGCAATQSTGIDVIHQPEVNIVLEEKILCEFDSYTISPNYANLGNFYSFEWNTGSTDSTLTVTGDGTGDTDTLVITAYSYDLETQTVSCFTMDTILIHNNTSPDFDLGPTITKCDEPNTTLTTALNDLEYNFQWSGPTGSFTSPTITATGNRFIQSIGE